MEKISKILKKPACREGTIYILACSLIFNTSLPEVLALEPGDVIGSSGVISATWGDNTIINTNHGAIIDWSNFNTSAIQSVTFNQYLNGNLSGFSAVLNRINSGGIPTQFNGALHANGRVFIVNPAGVVFGDGASVNVNQLIASSLNITDSHFLQGRYELLAARDNIGAIVNNGTIVAAEGVAMIGRRVVNTGTIMTGRRGFVAMAAGDRVVLGEPESNIVVEMDSVTVPQNVSSEGVGGIINESTGVITAPAGTIVLAAGDIFSAALELNFKAARVVSGIGTLRQDGTICADGVNGDGGSISLTAGDEVLLAAGSLTTASGGLNGSGGQVILQSEGTAVVSEGALIKAQAGSDSGDGGFVDVSGKHFIVAGDIDASAANGTPGTLLVDPVDVVVANGVNLGALDTVYEVDIENESRDGMNVLIVAEESITVQNIADDEITGGVGDITLRTAVGGSISPSGSIFFLDKSDAIVTTLGDIVIEAGGGGIDIGSLITGKDLSDEKTAPGQIGLRTLNGGNITAQDLLIGSGWGYAEICVDSSGSLTVSGDISVGKKGAGILNVPNGSYAEAIVSLCAGGDVVLNGDVGAYAHGKYDLNISGITWAYMTICAGTDETLGGDVTINGDLTVDAKGSMNAISRAYIIIEERNALDGNVNFGPGAAAPLADADQAHVESYVSAGDSDDGDIAKIIINSDTRPVSNPGSEPNPGPEPDPDLDPDPDPKTEPKSVYMLAAPISEEVKLEFEGCLALMEWVAEELGIDGGNMQVWTANSLASARDIQPCDTCARLKRAATVLQDVEGTRIAALAQVINEFASTSAPPSEEQMAMIAEAIANNTMVGTYYAAAGEYLDALAEYVGILNGYMDFSTEESITFAADKYVAPLASDENVGLATYIAARLIAMGG